MDKFDEFHKNHLRALKRLKEAESVIERFKEEMALAHRIEANIRLQLAKHLDRIVPMQKDIIKISSFEAQNKNQGKAIEKHAKEIESLSVLVQEGLQKVAEKISSLSVERELIIKMQGLEKCLEELDNKFNLTQIENQVALNEKDTEIQQLMEHLQHVTNERDKAKFDFEIKKNDANRVQLHHNMHILELRERIQKLEQEASAKTFDKNLKINRFWDKKENVTWADAQRKESVLQENEISSQGVTHAVPISDPGRPTFTLKTPRKTQAPLNIQAVRENSNQPKKKRLFSNNSNHFIE